MGLIAPILVGPKARIEAIARESGIDIADCRLSTPRSARILPRRPVAIVREGRAEALMKGSLHTDELMAAVVKRDTGLRTARRVSHCFVMDVPSYPETLIVTDAAVNIAPTMEDKVDIIQNAIDLAHALQFAEVRVAILSAMETINPKVPSTVEAGALCKMADRGQITGAILDGPLALDNAISLESKAIKRSNRRWPAVRTSSSFPISRPATCSRRACRSSPEPTPRRIVLGARVPIILTSRADSLTTRLASCAVAALVAESPPRSAGEGRGLTQTTPTLT
jgi:phosphate acetyltransferase